jgi:hypothetical protein
MMMTEMDIETLVHYVHLTRLIAREDYIKLWVYLKKSLFALLLQGLRIRMYSDFSYGNTSQGALSATPLQAPTTIPKPISFLYM